MSTDNKKPTEVVSELEGLKSFLDDNIPTLNESIPTLEDSIPVLDEQVEIPADIRVSYDGTNSTETIEEQLIRTRHEQQAPAPELVSDDASEIDEIPLLTESAPTVLIDVSSDDASNYRINPVDFNMQDQLQQLEEGATTGHPQVHEHLEYQNEVELEETNEQTDLLQQLRDIESEADAFRAESEDSSEAIINDGNDDLVKVVDVALVGDDLVENKNEILLEKVWTKVEMLLMDNLPTQLSGTFLQLMNSQIEENKQQIFKELSLLDDEMFQELNDSLDDDIPDDFPEGMNADEQEGF